MCGYFCIEFINYMLKGKTLLDYTNLFSPNDFKKNDQVIKRIFKKYLKEYFDNETKERKDIIKKLNKYLVSFDCLDKIFIAFSASFGTLSIASYAAVVGIPVGIAGSSLTLIFTIGAGVNKDVLFCNNKTSTFTAGSSFLERISQGSGIFDSLVYNANQDEIKDALLKAFK